MMDRTNRRNLVKIRRLAEQGMRQADNVLDIDRAWTTFSSIILDIDECLERNDQPYTGCNAGGLTPELWDDKEEEEGYVCCS